ncbi:5606_t:CDS:2 [Entrophospora sp. SA101]|nr:5606_t:CDS:2 [Entrophospora sp. SA101]
MVTLFTLMKGYDENKLKSNFGFNNCHFNKWIVNNINPSDHFIFDFEGLQFFETKYYYSFLIPKKSNHERTDCGTIYQM